MKKFFLLILAFTLLLNVGAQNIKTQSGTKEVEVFVGMGYSYKVDCKETYSYYIDENGSYVKHGSYSCSGSKSFTEDIFRTGNIKVTFNVTANYKDGKLDGTVKSTATANGSMHKRFQESTKYSMTKTVVTGWKMGKPHGLWKFTWTDEGKTDVQTANFTDGVMSGDYESNTPNFGAINSRVYGHVNQGEYETINIDRKDAFNHPEGYVSYKMANGFLLSKIQYNNDHQMTSKEVPTIPDSIKERLADMSDYELFQNGFRKSAEEFDYDTKNVLGKLYVGEFCKRFDVDIQGFCGIPWPMMIYNYLYKLTNDFRIMPEDEFPNWLATYKETLKKHLADGGYGDLLEYVNDNYYKQLNKEVRSMNRYVKVKDTKTFFTIPQNLEIDKAIHNIRTAVKKEAEDAKISNAKKECQTTAESLLQSIVKIEKEKQQNMYSKPFNPSESNPFDKLKTQIISGFLPIVDYSIDSVEYKFDQVTTEIQGKTITGKKDKQYIVYCKVTTYRNAYKSDVYQTQLYFKEGKNYSGYYYILDKDHSLDFEKAQKIHSKWDEVEELRNQKIEISHELNKCKKGKYSDVYKAYSLFGDKSRVKDDVDKDLAAARYNYNIAQSFFYILSLRKRIDNTDLVIAQQAGNDFSDINKSYLSYRKKYDVKMSQDLSETLNRLNALLATQDSCLFFIDLRKSIANNNIQITGNKNASNIVKVYNAYFKKVEIGWTSDSDANEKLRKIIHVQNIFKNALSKPNVAELNTAVKKLKDKSLENVLKVLEQ